MQMSLRLCAPFLFLYCPVLACPYGLFCNDEFSLQPNSHYHSQDGGPAQQHAEDASNKCELSRTSDTAV